MPEIAYQDWSPRGDSLNMVSYARSICAEYAAQGYDMTLRGVYYQFVARDIFPEDRRWAWTGTKWVHDPEGTKNAQPNYNWLKSIISRARLAGLLDWDYIVDRTRNLEELAHWESVNEILDGAARQFRTDKWATQQQRVEVWIEKDALLGVIEGVCESLDVPYFSCRGYTSLSELWRAGMRLGYRESNGQATVILHLGDHDPSGIDMTRDIQDRLDMFTGYSPQFLVKRIALNMDQIEEYSPPPNPTKLTDSRARQYIAQHGNDSWELDALEPAMMSDLIREHVLAYQDVDAWAETEARELELKGKLEQLAREQYE